MVRQVLLALGYAHSRGVVHRDLKPHNVFVRKLHDGSAHVTVLDFGLARFIGAASGGKQLTRAGMLIGTPAYMAPEQASGDVDAIDARTDVYAAGLLLFEVLAGRRPFVGNDPGQLMRAHLLTDAPTLGSADPALSVSAGLEALLKRALAKPKEERFADANEMLAALDALPSDAARRDASAPSVPRPEDAAESMASAATMAASPASKRTTPSVPSGVVAPAPASPRRSPLLVLALSGIFGVVLAVVGVIAVVVLFSGEDAVAPAVLPPEPEPAEPPPEEPSPEPEALRDPFEDPLPEAMAGFYARVERGGTLTNTQVRQIRSIAREHDEMTRARLITGHGYANGRNLSDGFEEYELAMEADPAARGYPSMLDDLVEMARSGSLERRAGTAIQTWYGRDALPAIEEDLAGELRPEEVQRLERLRDRISAM
jgi:hypothetical protein